MVKLEFMYVMVSAGCQFYRLWSHSGVKTLSLTEGVSRLSWLRWEDSPYL